MKKFHVFGFAIATMLLSAPAWAAQSARTFVSPSKGEDTPNCSLVVNPCKTLTYALTQTSPGGEIIAIDPANGYDQVNINKAVSIEAAPGVYAGITVSSGDGIYINAGSNDVVVLRGLTINGQGGFGSGIYLYAGGALHVENCVINGMYAAGIISFSAGKLFVNDSISRDNGSGITIANGIASINGVRLEHNSSFGILVDNGSVSISNSVVSGNGTSSNTCGIHADPGSGTAEINVESCLVANNNIGINSDTLGGTSTVRVSNSTVTDNNVGLVAVSSSVLLSRTNNTVEGNTTNGSFTGSYSAK